MKDRWTTEEYRRFLCTGKEPEEQDGRRIRQGGRECEKLEVVKMVNVPFDPRHSENQIPGKPDLKSIEAYAKKLPDRMAPNSEPKKRRKYGNETAYVDGIRFDSKHEASVYQELMLRVRAGELKCVCRQVHFDLGGGPHAQKDSRYEYVADFVTLDNRNVADVIDAKSDITRKNQVYVNKKKAMLALWGISITEM